MEKMFFDAARLEVPAEFFLNTWRRNCQKWHNFISRPGQKLAMTRFEETSLHLDLNWLSPPVT
jgi:hypothetical protein